MEIYFPAGRCYNGQVLTDALIWKSLKRAGPLTLIAGPCVIENERLCFQVASSLRATCRKLNINYIFKASYDKANRSSAATFRGPGLEAGLAILARIRRRLAVPVLTDVHAVEQVRAAAAVADILQIPAFLCRQTDLLVEAGRTGRIVNIKKGQFVAPEDMRLAADKVASTGNLRILLTERGTTFGYHNLVVDMRALPIMRGLGFPVIFDATHSVQLPGAAGTASGGQAEFIEPLARAAVATGVDGLFVEVHEAPERALSDGPNALRLERLGPLLALLGRIHSTVSPTAASIG